MSSITAVNKVTANELSMYMLQSRRLGDNYRVAKYPENIVYIVSKDFHSNFCVAKFKNCKLEEKISHQMELVNKNYGYVLQKVGFYNP